LFEDLNVDQIAILVTAATITEFAGGANIEIKLESILLACFPVPLTYTIARYSMSGNLL
jgi:hypothetical protein